MAGYMNELRTDCMKGTKGCIYLTIKLMKDISGKDFQMWYCKCEDEMCAGCIPTYEE